jgi:hypothetical protein
MACEYGPIEFGVLAVAMISFNASTGTLFLENAMEKSDRERFGSGGEANHSERSPLLRLPFYDEHLVSPHEPERRVGSAL